jgi:4-amino-4-deoxy-L-arabinose transferase-like glycosyltransferase
VCRYARDFRLRLLAVALVALVIRVAYIWFWRRGLPVGGDSRYYHEGANLLARGKGFIEPFLYLDAGKTVQAADHPPLYIVYLAMFSLIGFKGVTAHLLASALIGVTTVVVVGLVGRELVGARAGLIAAALAALYPNLWAYDGALESETMAQLGVALILLSAFAWWRAPSRRGAALLGGAVAFGALARAELLLLALVLIVPLVVFRSELIRRERVRQLFTAWIVAGLLIAPWCVYNLTRFERPVLLSGGFEITLDSASCDDTYYGASMGYWSRGCVLRALEHSGLPEDTDRSVLAAMYRDDAVHYIRTHLSRLPIVIAARVGRVTGLWNVKQQAALDHIPAGRETELAWAAWYAYFALALLSIAGGVILRRRRVPVFPLLVFPALVLFTTMVTFGQVRYRATAEVSLVLLAAVAIEAAIRRASGARRAMPEATTVAS